ncbi:hypothetical protein NK6_7401 [Bradyrhizobium diazoefficiens]|uniref:Uncharacterized protein n=1 Tax=Bradyrhizobium diazoefficiens TaxID=1355477 RepID=A0A0E4BTR1_9BRAD|nr:hypothetical protein NK6_7401 [Bradyrhizobium diazoefficiens]
MFGRAHVQGSATRDVRTGRRVLAVHRNVQCRNQSAHHASLVMPPTESVRQSDGHGIGPELSQTTRPARDRRRAPRHLLHVLVQSCPQREHANTGRLTRETCSAPRNSPGKSQLLLRCNPNV